MKEAISSCRAGWIGSSPRPVAARRTRRWCRHQGTHRCVAHPINAKARRRNHPQSRSSWAQ